MLELVSEGYGLAQQWLFETVVQPVVFAAGGASLLEEAYGATDWLLVALLELAVLLLVIGPLERWRPLERITDRAAVRVDVIYTLIHRLGLVRVGMFFAVDPLWNALWGWLAVQGWSGLQLDGWLARLWPGVTDTALAAFALYLLVLDLANYLIHRAQHSWRWWWALHALHHSQRQMTMWTDSRNHLLDMVLVDVLLVQLGHLIGVPPTQFVALVACTQLVENLSHANVRLDFGWLGSRLLVGPCFHRLHHAIGLGHESRGRGTRGGHNYGVLLPWWDQLLGTAIFDTAPRPTGIRDQLPEAGGRDYGRGFWQQQWLGLLRLAGRA